MIDEVKEKILSMISNALDNGAIDMAERLTHMYSELCYSEEEKL